MNQWMYRFTRWSFRVYFKWRYYLKVINPGAIPPQGGIIMACNHASFLDPPLVGAAVSNRSVYFMARSSLFNNPIFATIIRFLHALPIQRGKGPDQDWGLFLRLLDSGGALLVFPEGTRTENGELQRGKSGFARLVYMSKKPVYPVYIHGSYEAYPKHGRKQRVPITVMLGSKVELEDLFQKGDEKRVLREISERTMQAIAGLKSEFEELQNQKSAPWHKNKPDAKDKNKLPESPCGVIPER
jgi:1-acyl-sn-glycerol-3-phosphate acyltransferase